MASSAQQSIQNLQNLQNEEYVHEKNDDQSPENAPKITAAKEDHLQAIVNDIKKKVKEINIPVPETCKPPDTRIFAKYPKKNNHVHHTHHTKQKIKICKICPGQEC